MLILSLWSFPSSRSMPHRPLIHPIHFVSPHPGASSSPNATMRQNAAALVILLPPYAFSSREIICANRTHRLLLICIYLPGLLRQTFSGMNKLLSHRNRLSNKKVSFHSAGPLLLHHPPRLCYLLSEIANVHIRQQRNMGL
jgi:hypothetical protein